MPNNFNLKALYTAIDEERSRRMLTWSGVAKEIEERYIKMSPATIKGVGDKPRVEGDGVLQILLWLGREPESFVSGYRGELLPLRPAGPGKILRWDTASIFTALNQKREDLYLTWKAIADEIGDVTPQQLKGMAKGGRTFLPEAMRIALWLEMPVCNLTRESPT